MRAQKFVITTGQVLLALTLLIISGCGKSDINPQGSRIVLPLSLDYNRVTNIVTPSVTIYINGLPIQVVFDTGSFGLRVIKGALRYTNYKEDNLWVRYGYGDGISSLQLRGEVAEATLGFENLKSATPIRFMLIDSVVNSDGTFTRTDNIPAISANNFRGLSAIMGIGLRNDAKSNGIVNPFAMMGGTGKYLIHLPAYGENSGYVILNPNVTDSKGFEELHPNPITSFPLPNGWNSFQDDSLRGNVFINGRPYPGGTLLDTGNPLTWADSPFFPTTHVIKGRDTVVTMTIGEPAVSSSTFTIEEQYSGLDRVETNGPLPAHNSFGIQFFFNNDVLFDAKNGIVGIRKK